MSSALTKEEINRKLLHGLAVLIPAGIFYGPGYFEADRVRVFLLVLCVMVFALLIEFVRLKHGAFGTWFLGFFGSMMRKEEDRQVTGATYLMIGSVICSLFSIYSEPAAACAFVGLTLFILGDAAAALVGKGIGRIKIGGKTLEGSLGCFLTCVLLSLFVFPILPGFIEAWGDDFTLLQVVLLAVTVSVLELVPVRLFGMVINDNIYVPVATSIVAFMIR
jgi:dolichol kinase